MNSLYRISFFLFFVGGLIFAFHNQWIIIRMPWKSSTVPGQVIEAHKKTVKLWQYKHHKFVFESQTIIWDEHTMSLNAGRLVNAYLHLLYEENGIDKKIQVQGVTANPAGTELYLNFSHELFQEEQPIHDKWMLIEGLLQTIREQIPTLKTIFFLVNHRPLQDHHLDFSRPWPLEGFLDTTTKDANTSLPQLCTSRETCTIMLEPAGDAQYTGRLIDDVFERGITLQCAQELKKVLESLGGNLRVVLSRFPGEGVEYLQNAAFANRLKTNLYIALQMYQLDPAQRSDDRMSEISIYHCLYHPTTDFWRRNKSALTCEPYHQAHVLNCMTSQLISKTLFSQLKQIKPFAAKLTHHAGLPLKSLMGIVAPACVVEIGIPHKDSWHAITLQLAQQIHQLVINN